MALGLRQYKALTIVLAAVLALGFGSGLIKIPSPTGDYVKISPTITIEYADGTSESYDVTDQVKDLFGLTVTLPQGTQAIKYIYCQWKIEPNLEPAATGDVETTYSVYAYVGNTYLYDKTFGQTVPLGKVTLLTGYPMVYDYQLEALGEGLWTVHFVVDGLAATDAAGTPISANFRQDITMTVDVNPGQTPTLSVQVFYEGPYYTPW